MCMMMYKKKKIEGGDRGWGGGQVRVVPVGVGVGVRARVRVRCTSPSIEKSRQYTPDCNMMEPTTPPTMACVVDTGKAVNVAMSKNTAADVKAPTVGGLVGIRDGEVCGLL
jgi:hypothetical protein